MNIKRDILARLLAKKLAPALTSVTKKNVEKYFSWLSKRDFALILITSLVLAAWNASFNYVNYLNFCQ